MARKFREWTPDQSYLFPPSPQDWLPQNHLVYFLLEVSEPDLTADGLCRSLAQRWGLAEATRDSFEQQAKLPSQHLAKMRLLWSLMRMWMEWTYAWQRWPEFHRDDTRS